MRSMMDYHHNLDRISEMQFLTILFFLGGMIIYNLLHPIQTFKYLVTLPFKPKHEFQYHVMLSFLLDNHIDFDNLSTEDKIKTYLSLKNIKYKLVVKVPLTDFEIRSATIYKVY